MIENLIPHLRKYAESQFTCGPHSIHGLSHWRRVEDSARFICRDVDADLTVVIFFAYLHDIRRVNDGGDRQHGPRSADRLDELPPELSVLNELQMETLEYAIRHHTDGKVSDNITIGVCWDADRLDLGRVGIIPSETFMSTPPGKEVAMLGSKSLYNESKYSKKSTAS